MNNQITDAIAFYGKILNDNGQIDEALKHLENAALEGSMLALNRLGEICQKDAKRGDANMYFEKASVCCHCLDGDGFSSPLEYQFYKCQDCNKIFCQGCKNHCHKN